LLTSGFHAGRSTCPGLQAGRLKVLSALPTGPSKHRRPTSKSESTGGVSSHPSSITLQCRAGRTAASGGGPKVRRRLRNISVRLNDFTPQNGSAPARSPPGSLGSDGPQPSWIAKPLKCCGRFVQTLPDSLSTKTPPKDCPQATLRLLLKVWKRP
jgi:hypothetical protein